MLDILAISYKNIGPFKDKNLSIFFKNGKYLIKAPIGSGKSFLFFDGPMYGLYKYNNRGILNNKSKEGSIKILYKLHDEIFFITREIKKSKVKESCNSRLFTIDKQQIEALLNTQNDIISNQDLSELLQTITKEEIVFKNESDLQQTLQSTLPPREVMLNTVFLMQDSSNVFEVQPAERLEVLKNVFNLLGIDEAKEIIGEKKKEINYKIKATIDTSTIDKKLKNYLKNYLENSTKLTQKYQTKIDLQKENQTIQELKDLEEKLNIQDFSENHLPTTLLQKIQIERNQEEKQIQSIINQQEHITSKIQTLTNNNKEYETTKQNLITRNQELIHKLQTIDPEIINKLKTEKQQKRELQDTIEKNLPEQSLQEIEKKTNTYNINEAYLIIQNKINQGKQLNDKIEHLQLQIKNEKLTAQQAISKREQNKQSIQQQISLYQNEIQTIQSRILQLQQHIDQEAQFSCEKIGTNCPFIKIINQKTFKTLEQQQNELQEQQNTYNKKIQDQETILKTTTQPDLQHHEQQIKEKETELQQIEKQKESLKKLLSAIDRKQIQTTYEHYQTYEKEIKQLDIVINQKEIEIQQVENYRQEKEKNLITIQHLEEQIKQIQEEKNKQQKEREIIQKEREQLNIHERKEIDTLLNTTKILEHDIINLIEDNKKAQLSTKKLQEEEKILQNLYTIFSKELLLIALQDSLPIINDILNNYLGEIVDFQIQLSLITTSSEKIELEAKIIDNKGEREVKSLSGGQKIILKLTWILAISAYMRSPMIFLDETINNLDQDTIGKVADMLQDFMKNQNIKIYTITHSPQIQSMDIWDNILEIDKI